MQVTLCDVCEQQNGGIKHYVIPTEKKARDPECAAMDICPLCLGKLLCQLAQDPGKAAATLQEWIRTVQGR